MHYRVREVAADTRRVKLQYHAFSGSFTMTFPKGMPLRARREYLKKWAGWMEQCLQAEPPPCYAEGSRVSLLGRTVTVHESREAAKRGVQLDGDTLLLRGVFPEDPQKRREAVEQLLSPLLLEKARAAAEKYRREFCLGEVEIRLRTMRSRWGTCFPGKGKIHLSRYLIYQSESFLDEVVRHEMAHFLFPNHKKGFKELIKQGTII